MSFFAFNQLYGQWHIMSRADVRPNPETQPKGNAKKNVKVKKQPQAKVEVEKDDKELLQDEEGVLVKDWVTSKTDGLGPDTDNHSLNSREEVQVTNKTLVQPNGQLEEIPDVTLSQENITSTLETVANGVQSGSDSESTTFDNEENLKDIEYLHLPSQTLTELEARIKNSPIARRKFRLWKETMGMCIYCGKHINALDFVSGVDSDIEHILPRALGGRSNFDNLICSCRKCNRSKGDMTAMDYVLTLDASQQREYLITLRLLVSSGSISEEKYFNLLRPVMLVKFDKDAIAK